MTLVRDVIQRVAAEARGEEQFHAVLAALRASPTMTAVERLKFRDHEVTAEVGSGLTAKIDALRAAREWNLAIAPEIVDVHTLEDGKRVLVTRWTAVAGEELSPLLKTQGPLRAAAVARLRQDARTLLEHGLVHLATRGGLHWLIGKESGTIVLDHWGSVRKLDPGEGEDEEMMKAIEAVIERRGVTAEGA